MKLVLLSLFLLVSTILGYAEEVRVCPPWQLTVVDEKGKPVADCAVVQEWGYTFINASTNYATNVVTDAAGSLALPERWAVSPIEVSKFKKLLERHLQGQSEGPWATLFVWKKGYEGVRVHAWGDANVVFTPKGLRSKIVLRPEKAAK